MYTSGWPNSQNRCCHRIGSPPAVGSKKCVPHRRSNNSSNSPTVMIGSENTSRSCTTSPIHTNTGIRKSDMPGARMLMTVTPRLTAPAVDAMPVIRSPSA